MKADQITDGKINLISEVRRVLLYDRQTDGQKDTSGSKVPPPMAELYGGGGWVVGLKNNFCKKA